MLGKAGWIQFRALGEVATGETVQIVCRPRPAVRPGGAQKEGPGLPGVKKEGRAPAAGCLGGGVSGGGGNGTISQQATSSGTTGATGRIKRRERAGRLGFMG